MLTPCGYACRSQPHQINAAEVYKKLIENADEELDDDVPPLVENVDVEKPLRDDEELSRICNEVYLELRHYAESEVVIKKIAKDSGITQYELEYRGLNVLGREGKLPERWSVLGACVFGVDRARASERGHSGALAACPSNAAPLLISACLVLTRDPLVPLRRALFHRRAGHAHGEGACGGGRLRHPADVRAL